LLIFETSPENKFFRKQYPKYPKNLDIFTYINSKFVYVKSHVRTQIRQLYRNVLQQQCNLEQKVLKNASTLPTHFSDAFAYHIMQGPGYMALLVGEVIHIVKCVLVKVRLTQIQECYNQLPVTKLDNKTVFNSANSYPAAARNASYL